MQTFVELHFTFSFQGDLYLEDLTHGSLTSLHISMQAAVCVPPNTPQMHPVVPITITVAPA